MSEHRPLDLSSDSYMPVMDEGPGRARRWAGIGLLAALLGGGGWYGQRWLKDRQAQLASSASVQNNEATATEKRIEAAETGLRDFGAQLEDLKKLMAGAENAARSQLASARRHTQALFAELQAKLEARLNERAAVLEARLRQVESAQAAQNAQMAALEQQVADSRRQITVVRDEAGREVNALRRQADSQTQTLQDLEEDRRGREVRRVDFELAPRHTYEIVPGVTIHVLKTDPAYQRVSGWMWLMPDRRTIWLREQGAQRPVIVWRKPSGQK